MEQLHIPMQETSLVLALATRHTSMHVCRVHAMADAEAGFLVMAEMVLLVAMEEMQGQ